MRLGDLDALKTKLQARHDNGDEDFDKGYNIGIETAIDLIDNAPTVERPQSEWIPVSERLPDLWEIVLVTDECGNVFEYGRRQLEDDGNVCREWSFLGRNIIAWMPLPEPYKRGDTK